MYSNSTCVFWLLICVRCASSIVPEPENVSVVCKNFQTVVLWTYNPQLLLNTRFNVSINNINTRISKVVTTGDIQYNLGDVVWESWWSSRDMYTVDVSAISGDQESTRITSENFTFSEPRGDQVDILCTLDLPPVELLVNDQVASMSFQNPMKIRPELRWAADIQDSDPLDLIFDVTEDNVTHQGKCSLHDQMCTLAWSPLHRKEEHCVSVKARLVNDIQVVMFNQVDVCGQQNDVAGTYGLFLALLLACFALVVCVVVFMVWKAKACVRQSPPLPRPLDPASWHNLQQNIMDPQSEEACFLGAIEQGPSAVVTQEPPDPDVSIGATEFDSSSTPLRSNQGEYLADGLSEAGDQETLRVDDQETLRVDLSSGSPGSGGSGAGDCARSEESREDPEGEGGEVEEEPTSPYDRPHVHIHLQEMDMGAGDMVRGYSD